MIHQYRDPFTMSIHKPDLTSRRELLLGLVMWSIIILTASFAVTNYNDNSRIIRFHVLLMFCYVCHDIVVKTVLMTSQYVIDVVLRAVVVDNYYAHCLTLGILFLLWWHFYWCLFNSMFHLFVFTIVIVNCVYCSL